MVIKNKVRALRTNMDLTQEGLAEKVGVSRQTINAIENEKYNPSLELALKLGAVFNEPVEDIFSLPESSQAT